VNYRGTIGFDTLPTGNINHMSSATRYGCGSKTYKSSVDTLKFWI
jgi:hypothetical protein